MKLYDVEEGTLKLNDLIDLVGIVSLDPALANMDSSEQADILPPPSLVPRLHAVHIKKVRIAVLRVLVRGIEAKNFWNICNPGTVRKNIYICNCGYLVF